MAALKYVLQDLSVFVNHLNEETPSIGVLRDEMMLIGGLMYQHDLVIRFVDHVDEVLDVWVCQRTLWCNTDDRESIPAPVGRD